MPPVKLKTPTTAPKSASTGGSTSIPPEEVPVDAPPKITADTSDLTPAERKLRDQLTPLYMMLGQGIGVFGMMSQDKGFIGVGNQLAELGEDAATQWVMLSRKNETVKKYLQTIVSGVGFGGLIGVHLMIVAPLLVNRGMLPDMLAPEYSPKA